MLPSAAREDLSPEPPPPALGTDKKGVVGQGGDGVFFLGNLEPHFGEDKNGERESQAVQV